MKNDFGIELLGKTSERFRCKATIKCFCGNIKEIRSDSFPSCKSCGCIRKLSGINHKGYKGYKELSGEMWRKIIRGAESRNMEFSITIEEAYNKIVEQQFKCALSGITIALPKSSKDFKSYYGWNASLDRIDSTKGYIKNNIQWLDKKVNMIKQNLQDEEFISLCKLIAEYRK